MHRDLFIDDWDPFFYVKDRSDSKSERGPRHQVGNDALVGLTLVDLPELLLIVDFDADAVLEHVLNVLLPLDLLPVFVFGCHNFLEV